jgi:hypothetical protein
MYVPFFSAIYNADVKGAWMQRARDDKAFRRNKSAAAEPSATIAPLEELVSSEGEDVQQVVPV